MPWLPVCKATAERAALRNTLTEQRRGTAHERGYTARWARASKAFLAEHPLCAACSGPATLTDHIIPHRGDSALFWDQRNWQPMCARCHGHKTNTQDGGFGRPTRQYGNV